MIFYFSKIPLQISENIYKNILGLLLSKALLEILRIYIYVKHEIENRYKIRIIMTIYVYFNLKKNVYGLVIRNQG